MQCNATIVRDPFSLHSIESNISSPFAYYKDDKFSFVTPENPRTIPLTDIQKAIVLGVNELMICTGVTLFRFLSEIGLTVDKDTVQRQLKILVSNSYISKYEFISPDGGKSAAKAYMVGHKGRGFLLNLNKQTCNLSFIQSLDSVHAKKYLAAAQFVAFSASATDRIRMAQPIFVPSPNCKSDRIFRSNAMIQSSDGKETVFVEAIRQSDGWQSEMVEKLDRIDDVVNSPKKLNVQIGENIFVILVAESPAHMKNIMSILRTKRYRNITPLFTYDTVIVNETDSSKRLFKSPEVRTSSILERLFTA